MFIAFILNQINIKFYLIKIGFNSKKLGRNSNIMLFDFSMW